MESLSVARCEALFDSQYIHLYLIATYCGAAQGSLDEFQFLTRIHHDTTSDEKWGDMKVGSSIRSGEVNTSLKTISYSRTHALHRS